MLDCYIFIAFLIFFRSTLDLFECKPFVTVAIEGRTIFALAHTGYALIEPFNIGQGKTFCVRKLAALGGKIEAAFKNA